MPFRFGFYGGVGLKLRLITLLGMQVRNSYYWTEIFAASLAGRLLGWECKALSDAATSCGWTLCAGSLFPHTKARMSCSKRQEAGMHGDIVTLEMQKKPASCYCDIEAVRIPR